MSSPPGASASGSVQILDISYVRPLHQTQPLNYYLPSADTFFKSIGYFRDVLFYSALGHNGSDLCSIPALKHGLSTALVDFYPIAGRLSQDDATRALTIECNDAGVELVEAITDCEFHELEEKGFPILDFYDDLARLSHVTGHPLDAPLLSIQVTRFRDGGGIAIGFAASHVVFDGHSLWYFLNAWGQCCRGQGISSPPLLMRAVMKPECWLDSSELQKENPPIDVILPTHDPRKGYHRVMHFSSVATQDLKQCAIQESGNKSISSFQAVMACVWKRITAAQDLPLAQKVCMNIAGDVRQRLRPSLTKAYFGNAVEPVYVYTTAADLLREGIGAIATRINDSLKVLDDQAFLKERLKTNRVEEFQAILDEAIQGSTQFLFLTHGSKFPVYDVDVGMGRPVAVRPPTISSDGVVYVYPSKEQGGIDVCVFFSSLQTLNAFLAVPAPCIDI